jgi:hypothetical protein
VTHNDDEKDNDMSDDVKPASALEALKAEHPEEHYHPRFVDWLPVAVELGLDPEDFNDEWTVALLEDVAGA